MCVCRLSMYSWEGVYFYFFLLLGFFFCFAPYSPYKKKAKCLANFLNKFSKYSSFSRQLQELTYDLIFVEKELTVKSL